jgi:hypothetical protein
MCWLHHDNEFHRNRRFLQCDQCRDDRRPLGEQFASVMDGDLPDQKKQAGMWFRPVFD